MAENGVVARRRQFAPGLVGDVEAGEASAPIELQRIGMVEGLEARDDLVGGGLGSLRDVLASHEGGMLARP